MKLKRLYALFAATFLMAMASGNAFIEKQIAPQRVWHVDITTLKASVIFYATHSYNGMARGIKLAALLFKEALHDLLQQFVVSQRLVAFLSPAEEYIKGAVEQSSSFKNYAGMSSGYAGMSMGMDLPKDVDTSKMSGRQLKAMFGWQSITIICNANVAGQVPVSPSVNIQLFNIINSPGVVQANGNVFFPDPANPALGVTVSASRATYAATRSQTQTRAMNVKLVRMVVGVSTDFSQPFTYFKQDSFGNSTSSILIADEDFSPFQYQTLRADLPLDPTHENPHMGLIREDTGFQYAIQSGSNVRFILFIDAYHSPAMGLHPAMAQHGHQFLKGR